MKWIKKKKNSQDFQSINQNYNIETNMMEVKKDERELRYLHTFL